MVTAQQQISDEGQAEAAAADVLEIPESPEVFYGGMEDDVLHSAPTAGASVQQHPLQQQAGLQQRSGSIAAAAQQLEKPQKQSSRQRQKRARVCTRDQATKKLRFTAVVGAGQAAGSGNETEVDENPESDDLCPDSEDDSAAGSDSSDAEWSPEQQQHRQHKGSGRKGKHCTPVKRPNRQPFPEIQHSMAQARHLSSPTKNKLITDCFAAIPADSPAKHCDHSPAPETVAEMAAPATSAPTAAGDVITADAGTAEETSGTCAVTDPDAEEDAPGSNAASTGTVDGDVIVISDSDSGSDRDDDDGDGDSSSKYESEVHSGDEEALEEQQQPPDNDPDIHPQLEQQQQPGQQHHQHLVTELPAEAPIQLTQQQQPAEQPSQQQVILDAGWFRLGTQRQTFSMCKRSLSVTQIRENAAAEKAARLEAASQRPAMQLTQSKAAAAVVIDRSAAVMQQALASAPAEADAAKSGHPKHVAHTAEAELSRKRSAAAAGLLNRSVAAAAAEGHGGDAAAGASSPGSGSQLRTPAKTDAKTPSSEEQRQHSSARHGSKRRLEDYIGSKTDQFVDSCVQQRSRDGWRAALSSSSDDPLPHQQQQYPARQADRKQASGASDSAAAAAADLAAASVGREVASPSGPAAAGASASEGCGAGGAIGVEVAGGSGANQRLVLNNLQLLDSSHLRSWPDVDVRCSDILPDFNMTAGAREYLQQLVHYKLPQQQQGQQQQGQRQPARGKAAGQPGQAKQRGGRGRVAVGGSPVAAARPDCRVPFADVLDSDRGVYTSWRDVDTGQIVYMEFFEKRFHQFKQRYEDIFNSAEARQQLSQNILVAQGDSCHPCNHNTLEPLRTTKQHLHAIQQYYVSQQQPQAQQLQQQQQQDQQPLSRLLLAAHDMEACQLLGMYIPAQSGFILTSEDDERANADLTFEAVVHPYHMTFDWNQSEAVTVGGLAVTTDADPDQCIMALINDSTDWVRQMQQLARPCAAVAAGVIDACTCDKYQGRTDNVQVVQCLYKADDGSPVPVALFFTTRPVQAREELLWSYDDGACSEASNSYFDTQKINRATRTYIQLQEAMRQVSLQWAQEDSLGQQQLLAIASAAATECHSSSAPAVPILQYVAERRRILRARLATQQHVSSRLAHLQCASYVEKLLGTAPGCAAGAVAGMPAGSGSTATQQQASMQRRTRHGSQLQTLQKQLSEWRRQLNDPVQTVTSVVTTGKVGRQDLPPHWQPAVKELQQQLQQDLDQQGLMQQSIQGLDDVLQRLQQQLGCELVPTVAGSASRPGAQSCGHLQEQQPLNQAAAVDVPAAVSGVRTALDAAAGGSDGAREASAAATMPAVQAGAGATAAGPVASAISAIEAAVRKQLDATEAQCSALEERCRGKDAEVAALKALVLGLRQQLAERDDAAGQGSS